MKVVVSGAAGFVGKMVSQRLEDAGAEVTELRRSVPKSPALRHTIEADVLDYPSALRHSDAQVFVHLAGVTGRGKSRGLQDAEVHRVNIGGTAAALEACLLYTSPSPRDATLSRMPSSA